MTEYIEREKARDAVYKRIEELRADKEFDIIKEICVSGVKKHISAIPAANVVEWSKISERMSNDGKISSKRIYNVFLWYRP